MDIIKSVPSWNTLANLAMIVIILIVLPLSVLACSVCAWHAWVFLLPSPSHHLWFGTSGHRWQQSIKVLLPLLLHTYYASSGKAFQTSTSQQQHNTIMFRTDWKGGSFHYLHNYVMTDSNTWQGSLYCYCGMHSSVVHFLTPSSSLIKSCTFLSESNEHQARHY